MTLHTEIRDGSDSLVFKFPEHIDFETASNYFGRMVRFNYDERIVFDLSQTREVHSSFIGFLIDMKRRTEKEGGDFVLRLSPSMESFFSQTNLINHFNSCSS
jgi:anti-anti-sigma regulatory factor